MKHAFKYVLAMAICVYLICPITTYAGEAVDRHKGTVLRVGNLSYILEGSGYVDFSCPEEVSRDGDGVCQRTFNNTHTWQHGYKAGDEVYYLIHNGRLTSVLPKGSK